MFPTVAHADWSIAPSKRWIAVARRVDSEYLVDAPVLVDDPASQIEQLLELDPARPLLVGFDFPIGLPLAYARAAGIDSFLSVLPELGRGKWSAFYELAETPCRIGIGRPFYPKRPGGTSHGHLVAALGVSSMQDLLRVCERKTADRSSACSLFWTLGGQQVGRAAISGWRHVLVPAISRLGAAAGLWPFDGDLAALLATRRIVFAETYPAEACVHLGMTAPGRGWSKRSQVHRIGRSGCVTAYARQRGVTLAPPLRDAVADGFGSGKDGEDRFDAVVGVLSMLGVVLGMRPEGAPTLPGIRSIEGWILGLDGHAPMRCDLQRSASSQDMATSRQCGSDMIGRPQREHRRSDVNTITTRDGTRIYFKDWGSGQPIVFHHGWPLSADDWDAQMMFFLSQGYRVIAHDRRGHGRSTQTANGNDMDTYAADVAELAAHLNLRDAIHVGHSTGGGEVTRYVARHGEGRVAKAVLIGAVPPVMVRSEKNPGGLPLEVFDGFRAALVANRAQFFYDVPAGPFYGFNRPGAKVSQGVIDNWWRQGMMGGAKAHYDCIKAFSETDFTDDLKAIDVPVFIMHGDDDQIVPIADSALLAAKLVKKGTLKVYPGLPHGMCTTHPDVINRDLLAFIKGEAIPA